MIEWLISIGDRKAPLDRIELPAIREVTDPIRDHLAAKLAPLAGEGRLSIVFVIDDERRLSIRLRGDPFMVNQARDIIGEEDVIEPLLS